MKKWQYFVLTALLAASAVFGAFAAGKIFGPQAAFAQEGTSEVVGAKVLKIVDSNGGVRMVVTTTDDKAGSIIFMDGDQKVRSVFGLSKEGEPVISMVDKNQKQRLVMAVTDNDGPAIELYDANENKIWPKGK